MRVISEPWGLVAFRGNPHCAPERKSLYLRCTCELPQTPAGAPVPHGAAGLHAKSGAAWASWGRDQGWPLNQHCDSPLHARITANSRWGACSSWRCRAACQVWSSLGSLGPRSGSCAIRDTARVFPVHDRALPSMTTLIGCHNDGQGTERVAAQQHQLAWPRDAARSTSPRRSFSVRTIRHQGLDDAQTGPESAAARSRIP